MQNYDINFFNFFFILNKRNCTAFSVIPNVFAYSACVIGSALKNKLCIRSCSCGFNFEIAICNLSRFDFFKMIFNISSFTSTFFISLSDKLRIVCLRVSARFLLEFSNCSLERGLFIISYFFLCEQTLVERFISARF